MRGPNVEKSRCKYPGCGAELNGWNHKPHMGRMCRKHYRVYDKIRKAQLRGGPENISKERKGDDSASQENL